MYLRWTIHKERILVGVPSCGPICLVHKPTGESYLLEDLYGLLLQVVNAIADQICRRYP